MKFRLNLIVAACESRGIGVNGRLPWTLKNEMQHFRKITSSVSDNAKQNVVIMGRKTWESIPKKFRPLKDRVNIVISSTLPPDSTFSEGFAVFGNFESSVEFVRDKMTEKVEEIFIAGGVSLFEMAVKSPYALRIYYTHVMSDFTCDVFFPPVDWSLLKKTEVLNVSDELQTENGVQYRYEVYDRD